MPFLDFTAPTAVGRPDALPAGFHLVSLTKLAYIPSKDKVLAVFENEQGQYCEWLGHASEGSQKRTGAFCNHMAHLAEMKAPTTFSDTAAFDAWGLEVVEAIPDMTIELTDETYNAVTTAKLVGYFDKIIKPAISFDPTAEGF